MNTPASSSKRELLQDLSRQIGLLETGRRHAPADEQATAITGLDALLPPGGLPRGAFVELIAAADGAGAGTLGIVLAARACSKRKSLVVVDTEKQVYFPAAVRFGLELSRSIVVRPSSVRDAYQAIVQSLRSSAVGVVLGWQQWMSTRQLRCLHLAADAGGGLIILVRQAAALRNPSCAAVRLLVSPVACTGSRYANHLDGPSLGRFVRPSDRPGMRHIRVEVLRCRGRAQGESRVLEIDDETGHVHTLAAVATATALARPARAS